MRGQHRRKFEFFKLKLQVRISVHIWNTKQYHTGIGYFKYDIWKQYNIKPQVAARLAGRINSEIQRIDHWGAWVPFIQATKVSGWPGCQGILSPKLLYSCSGPACRRWESCRRMRCLVNWEVVNPIRLPLGIVGVIMEFESAGLDWSPLLCYALWHIRYHDSGFLHAWDMLFQSGHLLSSHDL